eukprot:9476476-Ditylum_brightwellii.AAC.1
MVTSLNVSLRFCKCRIASNDHQSSTIHLMHHVAVSFDILPPSRPMRSMSGVLESSHQALSIRRIAGLIG